MRYDEAGLAAFVAHQLNFVAPPRFVNIYT